MLSLTFVPALITIVITGRVQERNVLLVHWLKALYRPALGGAVRHPVPVVAGAVLLLVGAGLTFARLGQEFIPQLDEKNIAMQAVRIPSTSLS